MEATINPKPLPEIFVGKHIVNDRVKRYMKNKHRLLSDQLRATSQKNKVESHFVWYPLSYFETLIEEARHYRANGIRIYFGEYEEGHDAEGQLGLLLVLTTTSETGNVSDVIIENEHDYEGRASIPRPRQATRSSNTVAGRSREFNVYAPCPPACSYHEPYFPENDVP